MSDVTPTSERSWNATMIACLSLWLSCLHFCVCLFVSLSWPCSVTTMFFDFLNYLYNVCSLSLISSTIAYCKLCNIYMGTIDNSNPTYVISLIILLIYTIPKSITLGITWTLHCYQVSGTRPLKGPTYCVCDKPQTYETLRTLTLSHKVWSKSIIAQNNSVFI